MRQVYGRSVELFIKYFRRIANYLGFIGLFGAGERLRRA